MDKNGGEIRTLNQNGRLPVGVTVWYLDVFVRLVMIHMHTECRSCMCT